MRISDLADLSAANLWKRRLRTFLTVSGVAVGIGALVAMISFGKGMQENVTKNFRELALFNSVTVFPGQSRPEGQDPDSPPIRSGTRALPSDAVLDDEAVQSIAAVKGVEWVYPDINFPALVGFNGKEELRLVQVIPAKALASGMFKLVCGRAFATDDENSALVSQSFLRTLGWKEPREALARSLKISSLALDISRFDLSALSGLPRLPISREDHEFTVAGITQDSVFGGPNPFQNDIIIPSGAAARIKRLPFNSVWDLFRMSERKGGGYSALNVRLVSPAYIGAVKDKARSMGFSTFALADQFSEIRRSFIYMDMVLAAVGMIAIFVASLGIVNTMVMSILERFREIGVMKAVGAGDRDIKTIFFFESFSIGLIGGALGCGLGWGVSRIINQIVNFFLAKQGVPYLQYFAFPLWIFMGAVTFSILVSLAAGIYPARRAAKVDPVIALRHD